MDHWLHSYGERLRDRDRVSFASMKTYARKLIEYAEDKEHPIHGQLPTTEQELAALLLRAYAELGNTTSFAATDVSLARFVQRAIHQLNEARAKKRKSPKQFGAKR
jgi:hypothetical protein